MRTLDCRPGSRRAFIAQAPAWLAMAGPAARAAGGGGGEAGAATTFDETIGPRAGLPALRLRLRQPAGFAPPWPLVVYSHGLGGHLDSGRVFTQAWAAMGCLCVHVLHEATHDAAVFDAASAERTQQRVNAALAQDQVGPRCREVAAVLDHLLGHGAGGGPPRASQVDPRHVDARHVVIAGHSYGALTAMALAGRRLPHLPNGTLRDGRITAAIALSPGVHPVGRGETMAAVPVPMLCATGSLDAHVDIGIEPRRVRAGVPLANRLAVYRGLPQAHRMLLYLEGADHMTFAGEAQVDARLFGRAPGWLAANEAQHHAAVIEHTGAFLQRLRSADAAAWRAARTDFPGGYVLTGLNVPGTEGRR